LEAKTECPACGRRVMVDRDSCLYCGAALPSRAKRTEMPPPPAAPSLEGFALRSPRMPDVAMIRAEISGLVVHRCPETRGMWFDGPTFDFLIERQAERALTLDPNVRSRAALTVRVEKGAGEPRLEYLNCPVCGEQMSRSNYAKCSGVVFDRCLKHGVWLDDLELQQILRFIETGGHELAKILKREAQERAQLTRLHSFSGPGMWTRQVPP